MKLTIKQYYEALLDIYKDEQKALEKARSRFNKPDWVPNDRSRYLHFLPADVRSLIEQINDRIFDTPRGRVQVKVYCRKLKDDQK